MCSLQVDNDAGNLSAGQFSSLRSGLKEVLE
jgi:hypothetical protein